ncbi:MAG: hypothetical protein AAGA48_20440 [Myxococcota bacterium]
MRWWWIGAALVACDTGPDGPRSGEWSFSSAEVVSNQCQFPEEDVVEQGTFYLHSGEDEGVTIALPDNPEPLPCAAAADGTLYCVDELVSEVATGGAVITIGTELMAMFIDEVTGEVTQELDGDCMGSLCSLAASALNTSFPCTVDLHYDVMWRSDDLGILAKDR